MEQKSNRLSSGFRKRFLLAGLLGVMLITAFVPVANGADEVYDRIKYTDFNESRGQGYVTDPNAVNLAWREAATLGSYMNLYETYKETFWLDKAKDQIDAVMNFATDPDMDGHKGWYSSYESLQHLSNDSFEQEGPGPDSQEILANGGFETLSGSDPLKADHWTVTSGSTSEVYRTTASGQYYSGYAGMVVKYAGTPAVLRQDFSYTPGITYNVSFAVKTNNRQTTGKVAIYNNNSNGVIVSNVVFGDESIFVDDWMKFSFNFTAPVGGSPQPGLSLRLTLDTGTTYLQQPGWTVFFDDLSIKPVESMSGKLKNGSMELPDASDPTLPSSWQRYGAAVTANVYRSASSLDIFAGGAGLFIQNNGSTWQSVKQDFTYKSGETYTISFWGKASAGATGRVSVQNVTANSYVHYNFTNTEWGYHQFQYTAPSAAGQQVVLRLWSTSPANSWTFAYDNVEMQQAEAHRPQKLVNPSFETPNAMDATLPSGWERTGLTANSARTGTAGEFTSGASGVVLKPEAYKGLRQKISYAPDTRYLIKVTARSSTGANAQLRVVDADLPVTVNPLAWIQVYDVPTWTTFYTLFTAPHEPNRNIYIQLQGPNGTSGTAHYDDVSLTVYDEDPGRLHPNFETVAPTDSTLPIGWERVNATTATAGITTALNEYWNRNASKTMLNGVAIHSDGTGIPMLRRKLDLSPGAGYTIFFDGRTSDADLKLQADVYDETTNQVLGSSIFSSTAWRNKSFDFKAPSSGADTVYLRLRQDAAYPAGKSVFFDNVSMLPDTRKAPRDWTRVNVTNEQAYASAKSGNAVGSGLGLVVQGGTTGGYMKQLLMAYTPNKPYDVYLYGKVSAATGSGTVTVYDVTAGTSLAQATFSNTDWEATYRRLAFTTPGAGHMIEIRLSNASTDPLHAAMFDVVDAGENAENFVNQYVIAKPLLKFAQLVMEDPSLHAAYLTTATQALNLVKDDIFPKFEANYTDLPGTADKGVYVFGYDNRARWSAGRSAPHNQYLSVAECAMLLYDITGNTFYKTRATKLLNTFKSFISTNTYNSTASQWRYWEPIGTWDNNFWYTGPTEDSSHGTLDISAAWMGNQYGLVFDKTDLTKIAAIYSNVIWNGSATQPVIGAALNQKGSTTYELMNFTTVLDNWANYSIVDAGLWDDVNAAISKERPRFLGGAQLAAFNPEHAVNGRFELTDPGDTTLPALWQRFGGTPADVYRDTANAAIGKAGLTVLANGLAAGAAGAEQLIRGYKPNSGYTLKFSGKASNDAIAQGVAEIVDYTTSTVLASVNVTGIGWNNYSVPYITPAAAGHDLRVRLTHTAPSTSGASISFDELMIYADLWNSFLMNSGFEKLSAANPALPAYWSYSTGTVAANAVVDTINAKQGNASFKLTTDPSAGPQQLEYVLNGLKPGAIYTVTFYGHTNGSAAGGKINVSNETSATLLGSMTFTDTVWTQHSFTFTVPSVITDLVKLRITHMNDAVAGGVVNFDEVGVILQ